MNFCRKCQSEYEKPGTCNCFAPSPAAEPLPTIKPGDPMPWIGNKPLVGGCPSGGKPCFCTGACRSPYNPLTGIVAL